MAKPWLYLRNRPNTKGPGDREGEEGGARKGMGRVREGGWGKDRSSHDTTPPTCRRGSRHREGQPARVEREDLAEEQEPEGAEEGEDEDGETPRGAPVEVTRVGGDATPPEENADLLGFHP